MQNGRIKAQVDVISTLRDDKKIGAFESHGPQSKVTCSVVPTVAIPCGSGSGPDIALDKTTGVHTHEKALSSSSDTPFVAAASTTTSNNAIAALLKAHLLPWWFW